MLHSRSVIFSQNNFSYYQGKNQQSPWDRPDGFGIEASEGPVEISNTLSEHNYGDGLDSKSKRSYIHHCRVENNFADGVKIWGDSSKVENTLIYGIGDGNPSGSLRITLPAPQLDRVVRRLALMRPNNNWSIHAQKTISNGKIANSNRPIRRYREL